MTENGAFLELTIHTKQHDTRTNILNLTFTMYLHKHSTRPGGGRVSPWECVQTGLLQHEFTRHNTPSNNYISHVTIYTALSDTWIWGKGIILILGGNGRKGSSSVLAGGWNDNIMDDASDEMSPFLQYFLHADTFKQAARLSA